MRGGLERRAVVEGDPLSGGGVEPVYPRLAFRHPHGGMGCGSADKPLSASRAAFSSPSSSVRETSDRIGVRSQEYTY
jgi:hypothetical protein